MAIARQTVRCRGGPRQADHDRGARRRRQVHARRGPRRARSPRRGIAVRAAARARRRARSPSGSARSSRTRALAVSPRAEALLYAAARAQLVHERLEPLLAAGRGRAARPLRRLLAGLPGRRARAGGRAGARDQPLRHRRPASPTARCCCASPPPPGARASGSARSEPDRLEREDERFFAHDRRRLRRARARRARADARDRRRPAARAGARAGARRRRRGLLQHAGAPD